MKNKEIYLLLIIFVIVILIISFYPGLSNDYVITDKLYITEIVSRNNYIISDEDNDYSDYIELYNGYDYSINLDKYYLSDNLFNTKKYRLPSISISPHEYLIIYCDGKNKFDVNKKIIHTNFKLSKDGESLVLSNKDGNIINKIFYPSMDNDCAYGFYNKKYGILESPSPGSENGGFKKNNKIDYSKIIINEYMINNRLFSDSEGMFYDVIELYNSGDDVNIKDLYISDNINKLAKYKFMDYVFKKNSYLVIYCDDIGGFRNNNIYVNFKLSKNDNYIVLSNGDKIYSKIKIIDTYDNTSIGYKDNKLVRFYYPTIGYLNNTSYKVVEE